MPLTLPLPEPHSQLEAEFNQYLEELERYGRKIIEQDRQHLRKGESRITSKYFGAAMTGWTKGWWNYG